LIVECYLCLQHVEPRNGSRFKTILLILQLTLQKLHRLLVHLDELAIDDDLIKLRFHGCDELIQNIPEREVGAVALKKRASDLIESCAVKDQLTSENGDVVGNIACLCRRNGWCWRWICHLRSRRINKGRGAGAGPRRGTTARCCTGRGVCSEYAGASQVWINPFKFRVRVDLWQCLRADLNDHAFGAFDLLLRVEESRILLQRRQDRLVESKSWNPAGRICSSARITGPTKDAEGCKNPQDNKKFSHRRLAIRWAKVSAWIQSSPLCRSLIALPPTTGNHFDWQ
jgi:hypothetical protein